MIVINLNGERHGIACAKTVTELLRELGIPPAGTAVAVNGVVVPHDRHETLTIAGGERVDVLRPIGGG